MIYLVFIPEKKTWYIGPFYEDYPHTVIRKGYKGGVGEIRVDYTNQSLVLDVAMDYADYYGLELELYNDDI